MCHGGMFCCRCKEAILLFYGRVYTKISVGDCLNDGFGGMGLVVVLLVLVMSIPDAPFSMS